MESFWGVVFSGIGVTIILAIFYLWKRYCYHLKFEPVVQVKDLDSSIITLPVCQQANIAAQVNAAVTKEGNLLPTYQVANLNPYNNPFLMMAPIAAQVRNQQNYMNQKMLYLNSYRTYQSNIITQAEADKAMVAIPLILRNKGRAKGDNIEIELSFTGMLYNNQNKVAHQATKVRRPTDNGHVATAVIISQLAQENYTYHTWNLQAPLASPQIYNKNHMNPGAKDKEPFAVLYVNTGMASDIKIHWKVFESSLPNPVEGDIDICIN